LFESGVPVAVAKAVPNPALVGQVITLDGSDSYHQDPTKNIVSWEWDVNSDGIFEASGPFVTTTFATLGLFPVTLRVTDDNNPAKIAETIFTVMVTTPPAAPTADADGPYVFCPNTKPWFLDARKWEEDPATRYSLRYWEERKAEPPSDPFQSDYDRFATLLDIIESDRLDMLKALLDNGYPAEEIRSAKLRQPVGGYRAYSDPPYMFAENNDPQVKGWVFLQPVQRARRYGAKRILAYLASRPDCKGMFEDADRAPWNEATPAPVGSEALFAAIEGGKNGEVARLLDGKLDPNSAGSRGRTPLTLSASLGRNEVQERTVTLLLLRGADPDRADASGNLPLHLAARSGNSNMVESLLKSGAKVNRADGAGFVPYQYATTGAMEEQLRKAGAVAVPGKAPSGNR